MIILLISHFFLQTWNRTKHFTLHTSPSVVATAVEFSDVVQILISTVIFLKTLSCFTILITVLFIVYGLSHHRAWHWQGKHMEHLWLNKKLATEDSGHLRCYTLTGQMLPKISKIMALSEHLKPLVWWHSITMQKTWIFSYCPTRTSYLTSWQPLIGAMA